MFPVAENCAFNNENSGMFSILSLFIISFAFALQGSPLFFAKPNFVFLGLDLLRHNAQKRRCMFVHNAENVFEAA